MAISTPNSSGDTFPSFTGGLRYPAPDVARGFMLLLIAIANVPFWILTFPEKAEETVIEQWMLLVRIMFIDWRAYPLFSMLFGFGLMTMVNRLREKHIATRQAQFAAANVTPADQEAQEQWYRVFSHEGVREGSRLVIKRGWWMLLFGAIHGLFFIGDIIGAYAVVALLLGALIAHKKWGILYSVSGIILLLSAFMFIGKEWAVQFMGVNYQDQALQNQTLFNPLQNIILWVPLVLISQPLLSLIVPSVVIGARLADTDIITHPERYRRLLWSVGIGGLALAGLLALPWALSKVGFSPSVFLGSLELRVLGGIFGAAGWLALLTLLAGPARERLTGWRWVMSSVGRRSMTAYLSQTVLFLIICALLQISGVTSLSEGVAAAIAVGVWIVTVVMCVVMEKAGWKRGPFEVLLRNLVARSMKPTQYPVPQYAPAAQ
ncbi:MAG: DUF418 domain-containing protein [Actinomycetaceae bacterium]|nr:DUF418 domain-containing protein [Actinomycetaceae bacterium]